MSSEDVVLFVLINLGDSITVNPRSGVMCELTEVRRLLGGVSGVEVVCFWCTRAVVTDRDEPDKNAEPQLLCQHWVASGAAGRIVPGVVLWHDLNTLCVDLDECVAWSNGFCQGFRKRARRCV